LDFFLNYLKRPYYIRNSEINWSVFLKSWFLVLIVSIPLGPLIEILKRIASIEDTDFNYSSFKVFLSMVFLAPIIEELLFRLILKPKFQNLLIFLIFSGILAISFLVRKAFILFIIFLLLSVFCFIILISKKKFRKVQVYFLAHFPLLFYTSSVFFGFVHITNYEPFNYKLILIMPILVLPMILIGIILGFIRMKFGITYSVLLHSMINIFPFIFVLFGN
jgi:membrane protease YdiL (CAAX protease family)